MAERQEMKNENIKKIGELFNSGALKTLCDEISGYTGKFRSIKNALDEKGRAFAEIKKEEERVEAEKQAALEVNTAQPIIEQAEEPTQKEEVKPQEVKAEKVAKETPKKEDKEESEAEVKTQSAPEQIKEEVKVSTDAEVKEQVSTEEVKTAPKENTEVASQPVRHPDYEAKKSEPRQNVYTANPNGQNVYRPNPNGYNRGPSNPSAYNNRPVQTGYNRAPNANGQSTYRPYQNGQGTYRPNPNGQGGFNRAPNGQGGFRPNPNGQGGAPFQRKPRESYVAPPIVPAGPTRNSFGAKKKVGEKAYEEKHTISKRALIRSQVDVDDFDETKSGYRKFRPVKKQKTQAESVIKIEKAIINTEEIPLKVLSEKIGITAVEITKRLFKEGIMKTINDSVDFDTAAFIADDLGIELELKLDKTAEDVLSEGFDGAEDNGGNLVRRPPVVTVMGHVDHGKTSLLDKIRKTNVTAGEAGGITQHIGAYQVTLNGKQITFLDTPGHEAFTAMRARGAQATDIAIIVVAADDGIMPQTIEAINHAKAAEVSIIVAVNKIDKPEANIERIKTQLTEHGLLPEEWGGDVMVCPVSAKSGEGIDKLLEAVNLIAEIKDMKANPDRKAKGIVIEAKLDQSKGPIATVLIQNGTLKVSDSVVVGTVIGKIRAMVDDKGRRVASAGPSVPVSIMGLDDVPNSGDTLFAVEQEKLSKLVQEERKNKERVGMIKTAEKISLDDVFNKISEGEIKGLNIIVKADVQGSVEAVKQSLSKLSNEEVKVNVIHAAAGAINETDIMLAESSHAIIIGFNVRPDSNAKQVAEKSGVEIKLYRIIYEAIDDVQKALKGMLAPKFKEVYLGKAEVREVFKITGVGTVAGSYVTEGKISRDGKLRIYRNDVMITEGSVLQLKRFKDDVKEVAQSYECGISIEKFNDIKVGDFIECYITEEQAQ